MDWARRLADVEAFRGEPFDAFLVDWQLPDGSGLVGKTMHQVNERVAVEQIDQLKAIYSRVLQDYFA